MRLIVCCLFLAACGSSKSNTNTAPPEEELVAPEQDAGWTGATFDSPHCNHFIAKMTQCRAGAPDEAKGMLDLGMNQTVATLREGIGQGLDPSQTCTDFVEKAPAGLGEVCPDVEWGAP